jgi:hypothetical protein
VWAKAAKDELQIYKAASGDENYVMQIQEKLRDLTARPPEAAQPAGEKATYGHPFHCQTPQFAPTILPLRIVKKPNVLPFFCARLQVAGMNVGLASPR